MLTCKEVSELVSQTPERPLSFRERLGIKLHLMMCKLCSRFTRQMKFITKATNTFMYQPEECLDHDHATQLTDEARERIKNKLKEM